MRAWIAAAVLILAVLILLPSPAAGASHTQGRPHEPQPTDSDRGATAALAGTVHIDDYQLGRKSVPTMHLVRPSRRRSRRKSRRQGRSRKPYSIRRGEGAADGAALLRFAVFGDTHYWARSPARALWERRAAAQAIRDGLIIDEVDAIMPKLLHQLSEFAASGADFAVHTGDAVCGGSTFRMKPAEYLASLREYYALEEALAPWPIIHVPGNHDLDPSPNWPQRGGTMAWREIMCGNKTRAMSLGSCDPGMPNYGSIRVAGWRVLFLDAQDGLARDTDGHGHIGSEQLSWLAEELEDTSSASEQVILVMHQLLVEPPGASWIERTQDFIDNRHEVLQLLSKFDHIRLCLHGHVHANSFVTFLGIAFITTASAIEFPMHWREVSVFKCEIRLTTHTVDAPLQRERSRRADRRRGRNDVKLGDSLANSLVIQFCKNPQ